MGLPGEGWGTALPQRHGRPASRAARRNKKVPAAINRLIAAGTLAGAVLVNLGMDGAWAAVSAGGLGTGV